MSIVEQEAALTRSLYTLPLYTLLLQSLSLP